MFTFRLAEAGDLPALKLLVESTYRGDAARAGWTNEAHLLEGERISMEELADSLASPANRIWLAHRDGALIGTVTVTAKSADLAYLGMLCVDPLQQGGGLGRQLLAQAESSAAEQGAKALEMTVISARPELIAYYERRGYAQTGERRPFPLPDIDHLDMVVLAKALS
jgi:predicted GNAT family N-acyltransferase